MLTTASPKFQRRAAALVSNGLPRNLRPEPPDGDLAMTALLTETEVSQVLRVSLATLRKWRVVKRGPRFIKIGPLVRYQLEDLREWLSSLPTGGIASAAQNGGTSV